MDSERIWVARNTMGYIRALSTSKHSASSLCQWWMSLFALVSGMSCWELVHSEWKCQTTSCIGEKATCKTALLYLRPINCSQFLAFKNDGVVSSFPAHYLFHVQLHRREWGIDVNCIRSIVKWNKSHSIEAHNPDKLMNHTKNRIPVTCALSNIQNGLFIRSVCIVLLFLVLVRNSDQFWILHSFMLLL